MENKTTLLNASSKEDIEYAIEIGKTIQQQMAYPNQMVYFSWGAHNFVVAYTKDNHYPCLRFKVNGMKFKGYVVVIYNRAMDYYDVEFVSTHGNLKKRIEDVDCFSLQEKIDEYVEKVPEYKY